MIALTVLMVNTAMVAKFKEPVMQDISVTLELLPGVMKIRSVRLVTTVQQVLFSQSDAQKPSTTLVLVPQVCNTANLVKLATTASTTIVFHVSALRVISVVRRLKSPFHALRVPITHTRSKLLRRIVSLALRVQHVTKRVSMTGHALSAQLDIIARDAV